jgi:hypothetical protein
MSLVRPAHGNVIAQETVNGTAWLLRQLERSLFFGDSSLIPEQFDGLYKQILAGAPNPTLNTLDLRGAPMTEDAINDGALIGKTEPNYGRMTDLYCADGAFSDLAKQFYPAERYNIPTAGWNQGMVGLNLQGMYSQFGPIKFNPDVFIQFGPKVGAAVGNPSKIPSTPVQTVGLVAAPDLVNSKFTANDQGNYTYQITAINRYGRSAPLNLASNPVAVATGDRVTWTVGDGANPGTAFEIYRTAKNEAAATAKLMKVVVRAGATTAMFDLNDDIPGTSKAFLIQQNLEFFSFKQLAPFVKIPLATIDTSVRWMQLLYGTLAVYAPGKAVIYKNVGRAPGSSGLNNAALNSI